MHYQIEMVFASITPPQNLLPRQTVTKAAPWRIAMRSRTPETWRMLVDTINDDCLRRAVASIVFFDFFGGRPARDRWTHLDEYVRGWRRDDDPEPTAIEAELLRLGYPTERAHHRVFGRPGEEMRLSWTRTP